MSREFKILDYKFLISDQENENMKIKYMVNIYDTEKRYYRTIDYCNTLKEGKIKAVKYLAKIL